MALVMVVGLCYSAAASLAINRSRIVFFSFLLSSSPLWCRHSLSRCMCTSSPPCNTMGNNKKIIEDPRQWCDGVCGGVWMDLLDVDGLGLARDNLRSAIHIKL